MAAFPDSGDLFEGRYRIEEQIGSGGFARVYRARQEDLGRDVALKVLTPTGEDGADNTYSRKVAQRFAQEAKLVSRLRDAHTITMYDYGETEDGLLYMVFEFVNGDSLTALMERGVRLEPARVMKIVEQTLQSLQEAHALGVMHRDIKPGNIMVFEHIGRKDQVKVLDFGIAKLAGGPDLSGTGPLDLTGDGALVGTPRYMSPEQIRGEPLGPQSDIYSLGLVAYELLVGEKAIASNSSVTIIGRQLDPRSFLLPEGLSVPYGVRHVVNKMLAKDTSQRYRTADEALKDVSSWEALRPASVDPTVTSSQPLPAMRPEPVVEEEPAESRAWIGGIALLCIALSVAVVAATVEPPRTPPADSPGPVVVSEVRVDTRPAGLQIEVNGRNVGTSPITLKASDVHFPAIVAARLDEQHERKVEVPGVVPSITVDFTDVVRQREAQARAKLETAAADAGAPPPEPVVAEKPHPKPKPRPEPKPKPKPAPKPTPMPTFVPMDKHE